MLVTLGEDGIKTLDDLADLAGDELVNRGDGILRNFSLGETEANAMIMAARAHWFADRTRAPTSRSEAGLSAGPEWRREGRMITAKPSGV